MTYLSLSIIIMIEILCQDNRKVQSKGLETDRLWKLTVVKFVRWQAFLWELESSRVCNMMIKHLLMSLFDVESHPLL